MDLRISEVRITPVENERLLVAYVSFIAQECLVVREAKIVRGRQGLFLSMPSKKRRRMGRCPCSACNEWDSTYCRMCGEELAPEPEIADRHRYLDILFPMSVEARATIVRAVKDAASAAGITGKWQE